MRRSAGAAFGVGLWATGATAAGLDGLWAVQMVTDSGFCDKSYDYLIAVEQGQVRYIPEDSDPPPLISGSVSPTGAVNLDIQDGIARVGATGELKGTRGAGSWRLSILCAGRWTAQKRGPP